MAHPISTSSDVQALVVFAFQSSSLLCQVVTSLVTEEPTVRELKEELEDLNTVLEVLRKLAIDTDNDLTMLRIPLFRCGNACKDVEGAIVKYIPQSGESRITARDWMKLKYMEGDMSAFKNQLAGYKSTIMIALSSVNM
jgi:hypothetical protein